MATEPPTLADRFTLPHTIGDSPAPPPAARRDTSIEPAPASRPPPVDLRDAALLESNSTERYTHAALLGEGGMGEVRLCRDARIGREVAMKVIRSDLLDRDDVRARFVREARVQGQLEHPAVVPVYDLGISEGGETWFTMQRVRGRTLSEILEGLATGDAELSARHGRRRLLSAFSSLCLAVDFAHSRGVLHRDLKPGNVMLGDYGEVFLLDWGLARLLNDDATQDAQDDDANNASDTNNASNTNNASDFPDEITRHDLATPARTEGGIVLGTPGFMAPEQARGDVLTTATDVYALGAILFELLSGQPLHRGKSSLELIASTLVGADPRPSLRAPDRELPPELDRICARATALDPADRYPSARALQEAVELFLDGDRDLELRHQLSARHAEEAEAAAALARAALDPLLEQEERSRALREVSRALALDPKSDAAVRTLLRLMTEPPSTLPAAAATAVDRAEQAQLRFASTAGSLIYLSWLLFLPWLIWLGLRSPLEAALTIGLMTASAGLAVLTGRRAGQGRWAQIALIVISNLGIASASRSFGPFILAPGIIATNTLAFLFTSTRRLRPFIVVVGLSALLGPVLLEHLGVLPRSYLFRDGVMVIIPQLHSFPEVGSVLYLCMVHAATLLLASLFVSRLRTSLTAAERRLQLYVWQLARLLPEEARGNMGPAPAPPGPHLCATAR